MRQTHLSAWEQEEYVIGQRMPEVTGHLAECAECQASVAGMQQRIALFREAALGWSAEHLEKSQLRVPRPHAGQKRWPMLPAWQWALAVLFLLLLLPLYRSGRHVGGLMTHSNVALKADHEAAPISDDALLQQVDEETSEAVPSSMEPLTHLVTTNPNASSNSALERSQAHAQTN